MRIKKLTFSSSTWVEDTKIDKICLCESVGKIKGILNQGEEKMNEMKIHIISDLQRCFWSYWFPKVPIPGFGQNYEHGPEVLARKPTPFIKYHRKSKNSYFLIYGEIWVDKLRSSSYMLKLYCITDVIRVMVKKG